MGAYSCAVTNRPHVRANKTARGADHLRTEGPQGQFVRQPVGRYIRSDLLTVFFSTVMHDGAICSSQTNTPNEFADVRFISNRVQICAAQRADAMCPTAAMNLSAFRPTRSIGTCSKPATSHSLGGAFIAGTGLGCRPIPPFRFGAAM
jgi:hypothetical protein